MDDRTPTTATDPELLTLSAELDAALTAGGADPGAAAPYTPSGASGGSIGRLDRHRRIAAALVMIAGGLVLLVTAAAIWLLEVLGALDGGLEELVASAALIVAAVFAVTAMLSGWGFGTGRRGARIPMVVVAVLCLPFLPVGTAVGVYVLWVVAAIARAR